MRTTAILWHVRVDQAKLPRLGEHLLREFHRLIVLGRDRDHFVDRKGASKFLERMLLVRQSKRVSAGEIIVIECRRAEAAAGAR